MDAVPSDLADGTAFVLDVGAVNTYWGYAGQDGPLQQISSASRYRATESAKTKCFPPCDFLEPRENVTPRFALACPSKSIIRSYVGHQQSEEDCAAEISNKFAYIGSFFNEPNGLKDRALTLTDTTSNTPLHYERQDVRNQIAFEEHGLGAFFIAKKASLAALALGRSTALVVETGPVETILTPVLEGYSLSKSMRTYPVGGYLIDWLLATSLDLYNPETHDFDPSFIPYNGTRKRKPLSTTLTTPLSPMVDERLLSRLPSIDPQYMRCSRMRIVSDISNSCVKFREKSGVRPLSSIDMYDTNASNQDVDDLQYELPDGKLLCIPKATVKDITEYLFAPADAPASIAAISRHHLDSCRALAEWPGFPTAILSSAFGSDVELVPSLLANVVICGGPSAAEGFMERLSSDLDGLSQVDISKRNFLSPDATASVTDPIFKNVSNIRIKLAAQASAERKYTTWCGASILSSLSSFDRLWVTRAEWQEYGTSICSRRFVF